MTHPLLTKDESHVAEDPKDRRSILESVKAPLIFSFALGVVAGVVTLIVSSGGTDNPRVEHTSSAMDNPVNLALLAFGIAFIASLLIVSMLQLASRENPAHLSEGSGVNRRSEELYRQQVAARREKARQKEAEESSAQESQDPQDPDYGQRSE
ncbi:hypothetical protein [Garicola koreensis]|uniref:Uncharacterized protein n=1 Tax=Garicola koreensis TaxID=1262554 RepID=A0A7W5TVE2_9MICC|nr:hypothetical protein [Garicola koreensis]MBB3668258.1 hypothetical protein [Garicola koreensis]MBB3668493.1 hypothetical protein [Garicola koreensis]